MAALEEGITTPTREIYSPSRWVYPNDPTHSGANCAGGNHGLINVTEAITKSCNYFFAEMGYEMGMDTFREYLQAFGLGEHTGIEIGDYAGTLPSNEAGHDQTPGPPSARPTSSTRPPACQLHRHTGLRRTALQGPPAEGREVL